MKKKMHLSIPEPCHEDWQNMTPQEQGRFCGSCRKTVVDFSNMSDTEVLNYFTKASGRVCGRFEKKQVNKTYQHLQPVTTPNWLKAGILATGLLTSGVTQAQNEEVVGKIAIEKIMGDIAFHEEPVLPEKVMLKGTVSNETGEVLIGASVLIVGTEIGTIADLDGKYELEIPAEVLQQKTWTIEASYTGFETERQTFKLADIPTKAVDFIFKNEITLHDYSGMIAGMVMYVAQERTLWQETKDWIRGLKYKIEQKREATIVEIEEQNIEKETVDIRTLVPTDTTAIDDKLTIFPNPFVEKLILKYTSKTGEGVEVRLINERGQVVFKQKETVVKGENTIDLAPTLSSGTYWLHLDNGKDEPWVKTVVHLNRA
jgi:hypothetical protein